MQNRLPYFSSSSKRFALAKMNARLDWTNGSLQICFTPRKYSSKTSQSPATNKWVEVKPSEQTPSNLLLRLHCLFSLPKRTSVDTGYLYRSTLSVFYIIDYSTTTTKNDQNWRICSFEQILRQIYTCVPPTASIKRLFECVANTNHVYNW